MYGGSGRPGGSNGCKPGIKDIVKSKKLRASGRWKGKCGPKFAGIVVLKNRSGGEGVGSGA